MLFFREELEGLSKDGPGVNILSGLVWLSPVVSESLLKLHCMSPLDGCTYMGVDSGEEPLQISLYYDILTASCPAVTAEDFVNGKCGKTLSRGRSACQAMLAARKLVWTEMRRFRIQETVLAGLEHRYLPPRQSLADSELLAQLRSIPPFSYRNHSLVGVNGDTVVIDAVLQSPGTRSLVYGRVDRAGREVDQRLLNLCKNPVEIVYQVENQPVAVIFSIKDSIFQHYKDPGATFLGLPWTDALEALNLTEEMVWPNIPEKRRCLHTAQLYRVNGSLRSLQYISPRHDIQASFLGREQLNQEIVCSSLQETRLLPGTTRYRDIYSTQAHDQM